MASQKNILGFKEFRSRKTNETDDGLYNNRRKVVGEPDLRTGGFGRPQHLIGLLFAHGSRARRNSLPRANIRISVFTPSGKTAIKIRV